MEYAKIVCLESSLCASTAWEFLATGTRVDRWRTFYSTEMYIKEAAVSVLPYSCPFPFSDMKVWSDPFERKK